MRTTSIYRRAQRRAGRASCQWGLALALGMIAFIPTTSPSQDVWIDTGIYMDDDVVIDARIIKPLGFPPSGGFPGIVLVHGYGGRKEHMEEIQIALATYGYASLAYSVRGQGNSGGVSTVDAERETEDLVQVIQFFRNTRDINRNKLGVTGGSQGGIHSWMAAVHRMPGVKAVAPLIATPDFAATLVPNGCIRTALPRELRLSTVRYSPETDRLEQFVVANQYDSILTFIAHRDLASRVGDVQIPVLQVLGWGDIIFPANGGIRARNVMTTNGVPVHSYFGTNGHGLTPDPLDAGPTLLKLVEWFDHWLRGFSMEGDNLPLVVYSDDRLGFDRDATVEWPPPGAFEGRFYLTPHGLADAPPDPGEPETSLFSLTYDTTYGPQKGWDDLYGGEAFMQAFSSVPLRFVTPRFDHPVEITGIPTGRVYVRSDDPSFQVHVRLYEVNDLTAPDEWTLFSRSIHGIRNNTPGELHAVDIEGTAISHVIDWGHRLGVEITSLDMLSETQAHTIPYFASTSVELVSSIEHPSYVLFGDTTELTGVAPGRQDVPSHIDLEQNYPNPFNPSTEITFVLPKAGRVTLTVCDILGREVATLVDEVRPAGRHTVWFNASGLSSGVYFSRLVVGDVARTGRMVLLK
jgi:predicted acyl esterase